MATREQEHLIERSMVLFERMGLEVHPRGSRDSTGYIAVAHPGAYSHAVDWTWMRSERGTDYNSWTEITPAVAKLRKLLTERFGLTPPLDNTPYDRLVMMEADIDFIEKRLDEEEREAAALRAAEANIDWRTLYLNLKYTVNELLEINWQQQPGRGGVTIGKREKTLVEGLKRATGWEKLSAHQFPRD